MIGLFNRKRGFRNTPQTKLTDSNGAAADDFGYSVALSENGTTAVIGSTFDDVGSNPNQGSAVVFTRSKTTWTEQTKLTDSNGATNDNFGWSVALSDDGNTVIVGAPFDDVGANTDQGSAVIYTRSGSTWTEQTKLTYSSGLSNDRFGWSVALSGDGLRAVVGAPGPPGGSRVGRVHIYLYSGGSWSIEQTISSPADDDFRATDTLFGNSIAFSEDADTLVVGAPNWDVGTGSPNDDGGAALIYTRSGSTWSHQATLKDDESDGGRDYFGWAVALSSDGNTLFIGEPEDTVGANSDQGSVVVYTRSGTTWTQQTRLTDSAGEASTGFGFSLALSGDGTTAIIGTGDVDYIGGTQEKVIVFNYNNNIWKQINTLTDPNGVVPDLFGSSVALSRNSKIALVGAYRDDVNSISDRGSAIAFYRR